MKIISTNIAKPQTIIWRGKEVSTGIYKYPVENPLFLGLEDVKNDHVIDRRYHGGKDKACYLYSEKHYAYWKNLYPTLDWQWGMFGENLTVEGLDETQIRIGDIFKVGETKIQVTQPRQPCFKLGVRFGTQKMVKQFVEYGYAGVYVRILKEGLVKKWDTLSLIEQNAKALTIKEIFILLYTNEPNKKLIEKALNDKNLAESCKKDLQKKFL